MSALPNMGGQIPVRMSPFEPVKTYQTPKHLESVVLDQEITKTGVQKLLFDPASLSLRERESGPASPCSGRCWIGRYKAPRTWRAC